MIRSTIVCVAVALSALALADCQGSSGTGGLSIPAPAYNAPAGPGSAASSSRQQALDGAVTLTPDRTEIPLPTLDGFSVNLELGTPPPVSAVSPAPSPSPSAGGAAKTAVVRATPPSTATPSIAPSVPFVAGYASPSASPGAATGSPSAAASKIVTKTTVYPDDAPAAPSPKPSGDVQTFTKRTAIVRGYIVPASDITLYGLGAIRFTIPQAEQTSGRAFTVAVFSAGKKHHEALLAFDATPTLENSVVASSLTSDPLTLKKAAAYLIMLYGDELAPTPAPAGAYPTPGTNPFPTQTPGAQGQAGYPQEPHQPGYPQTPTATPVP